MLTVSSWDFTMENYGAVWAFMVQLGLLLLFLVLGNIIRRTIPLFRKLQERRQIGHVSGMLFFFNPFE